MYGISTSTSTILVQWYWYRYIRVLVWIHYLYSTRTLASTVYMASGGQLLGWCEQSIEMRSVDTGYLDGVFRQKRKNHTLRFLCERNQKVLIRVNLNCYQVYAYSWYFAYDTLLSTSTQSVAARLACALCGLQIFFASIKTGGVSQIYIMDLGSSSTGALLPPGASVADGALSAVGSPEQSVLSAASPHNAALAAQFSLALGVGGADDDALWSSARLHSTVQYYTRTRESRSYCFHCTHNIRVHNSDSGNMCSILHVSCSAIMFLLFAFSISQLLVYLLIALSHLF